MLEFLAWVILNTGRYDPSVVETQLETACQITGGECPKQPRAYFVPFQWGLWGAYYYETPAILISDHCDTDELDVEFCDGIVLHELVHYVVDSQGRYRDQPCANERLAWAAFNSYVILQGRYDLMNVSWEDAYEGCGETT